MRFCDSSPSFLLSLPRNLYCSLLCTCFLLSLSLSLAIYLSAATTRSLHMMRQSSPSRDALFGSEADLERVLEGPASGGVRAGARLSLFVRVSVSVSVRASFPSFRISS